MEPPHILLKKPREIEGGTSPHRDETPSARNRSPHVDVLWVWPSFFLKTSPHTQP